MLSDLRHQTQGEERTQAKAPVARNSSFRDNDWIRRLASQVLDLDPGILGCHIIADPGGAVLADVVRPGLHDIGTLSQVGSGMGPLWGIAAINAFKRFDTQRSKLKHVVVTRDVYKALIFPFSVDSGTGASSVVFGIELSNGTDASKVYDIVMGLIADTTHNE